MIIDILDMPVSRKLRKPFRSKKDFKTVAQKCHICGEDNYNLLDVHRINEGQAYSYANTACLCVRCHRLHHSKSIIIKKWYNSTMGRVLHWIDELEKEHFS